MRSGASARATTAALLWLAAAAAACAAGAGAETLHIGVVEEPARAQRLAAAVDAALRRRGARVAAPEPGEPLALPDAVCALAGAEEQEVGCAVVGGAGSARAARLGGAGAARAGLPLLFVDPAPADATWEALALYPHPEVLAKACADLFREKGWRRAALLHDGSAAGAALLAAGGAGGALGAGADGPVLLARRLPPLADPAPLRNLLLVLKQARLRRFVVWCSAECTATVLRAAQRVGLLSEQHAYIALALDLQTQPLADCSHGGANITALRLFDPLANETKQMMSEWRRWYVGAERAAAAPAPATALVLALEGARLASAAWAALRLPRMPRADCRAGRGAFHADTLLNYIRSDEWEGWDGGKVSWEADGSRRDVPLQVVELVRGGELQAVGRWAPRAGVRWQRPAEPARAIPRDSMKNRTFTVLIALNNPYIMRRESQERLTGNNRYEGFCIELIDELAKLLGFNYTLVETTGGYGSYSNKSHKWEGMLGRLMEDNSTDFAITDLTITAERERAVDFTTPFMNLGIAVLFHAPTEPEPKLFAFLLPFSNDVWLCLGCAYVATSLVLYGVGRLCHEEWQNPYPCLEEPPALENQFTLANALWFNLGAVLLQGSEIAPVAYGTRAVASVWWLFALVITSSYTANLATLLAQNSPNDVIRNVQDLVNNSLGIDYGAKAGGSTYTFFEHSQSELYRQMYAYMKDKTMPTSNEEGIKKVQAGGYAFLMESTSIDYETERRCDVVKIGSLLDSKGYGIAMRKGSEFRQALNLGLLSLQEAGKLREMTKSWWEEKHGGGACKEPESSESKELEIRNFRGLFLVLAVGCALGAALSACELALASWRRAAAARRPFSRQLLAELRIVFRFEQSVKPLGPLSGSSSGSPRSECGTEPGQGGDEAAEPEEETEAARARVGSLQSGGAGGAGGVAGGGSARVRRRSSMHAASMRLARHAARDSDTPAPAPLPKY